MKLVIGLKNEYEGDAPLYFDLNAAETPQLLVNHLKETAEFKEERQFFITELSDESFDGLDK